MCRYVCLTVMALAATGAAVAQVSRSIPWLNDPQQGVELARQSGRPLVFYVLAATKDRDNKLERAQAEALDAPRVLRLMSQFVPVRLSRSVHRDLLPEIGLSSAANMEMAFVAPDGSRLDTLSSAGVADADVLAQKLQLVLNFHRQRLFDQQLRPVLEKRDAEPAELWRALQQVRDLRITAADTYVARLLEREALDKKVAGLCYDTLAELSTKAAVEKLLDLSAEGRSEAAKALERCNPAGAEIMLERLITAEGYVRLDVYNALVKICRIKNRKSDRWWERVEEPLLKQEVERVSGLVKEAAARWKAENE